MPEAFVALADLLRTAPVAVEPPHPANDPPGAEAIVGPGSGRDAVLAELARFRLAAREAYERATASLVIAFARDVLARELRVAPPDLASLAARALETFRAHEPVALVVPSEGDAASIETSLPVRVDAALERGDLVVEVRGGAFESPLAFRLSAAIDAALASAEDGA